MRQIKAAGGNITTPKHAIGDWGFMADFKDPEGNDIGLWEQPKKNRGWIGIKNPVSLQAKPESVRIWSEG